MTDDSETADELNGEQQEQRPRISREEPQTLERRLGRVLAGNGGNTSSQELQDMLNEVEAALIRTQADADRYHAECLDLDCADLVAAKHNEREAMLRHQRLHVVRPRIEDKLKRTLREEYDQRWASNRARTAEKVKASARRFADLEELMAEMIDIFHEAQETDNEVDRCNAAAPSGAPTSPMLNLLLATSIG